MSHAVRGFFDNGGRTAYIVNVAPAGGLDPAPDDFIGQQGTEVRGLQALERIEHVDLLVAPDLMFQYGRSVAFQDPAQVLAVQRAMIDHCRSEERRVGKECRSRWAPDDEEKRGVTRCKVRGW